MLDEQIGDRFYKGKAVTHDVIILGLLKLSFSLSHVGQEKVGAVGGQIVGDVAEKLLYAREYLVAISHDELCDPVS